MLTRPPIVRLVETFVARRCGPTVAEGRARGAATSVVDKPLVPDKIVQHPYTTKNMRYLPGFSFPAPRKLEDIVKYALLERESPTKIKEIWNTFHDKRVDSVATIWSGEEFAGIAERKRRCPRFIYPVLKGDGKFFNLVAEWQDNFCIFTYLDDYRKSPGSAEPYLSIALFDDLLVRKQLVLVRGDFSGHLTKRDAVHIVNLMRHFYFAEPKWVELFNRDPGSFDFTTFLANVPQPPAAASLDAGKLLRDATTTGLTR
jgi:hypothetical protein